MKTITPKISDIKKEEARLLKWNKRKELALEIWLAFLTGSKILLLIFSALAAAAGIIILMVNFALWMIPVCVFVGLAILTGLLARSS